MAKFTIPCLVGRTNKAKITSWYWQPSKTLRAAKWQPVALGKDETAAIAAARALNEQVERWKSGGKIDGPLRTTVAKRESAGTFRALIGRYRREVIDGKKPDGSPRLKPKTRAVYETSLPRLDAWAGKHPVAYITPARVRALRDATAKPVDAGGIGHSAAFALLRVLRQVMAFAEKIDMIPKGTNPATHFDLAGPAPRSTIWTADDEAAFIAAAYELERPGMALAIELALYTAQREGDLIGFTEAQLGKHMLCVPVGRVAIDDTGRRGTSPGSLIADTRLEQALFGFVGATSLGLIANVVLDLIPDMSHHRANLNLTAGAAQIFVVTNNILFPEKDLAMGRTVKLVAVDSKLVLLIDKHRRTVLPLEQLLDLVGYSTFILGSVGCNADTREVTDSTEHFVDTREYLV